MRVINECRVDFQYKLSTQSPVVIKTIASNMVSTDIVKDIIKIEKYTNKRSSCAFDILTYTICIKNISKYVVTNVFFRDKIPGGTRFIENTVTINNTKRRCINPDSGFRLWDIDPEEIIKITFKVVVLPNCFCNTINNFSTIEHDYIYNIEKPPTRIVIESNKVKTKIKNKVFKTVLVDNKLEVCDKIQKIIDIKVEARIIDTKIAISPANDIYANCNDSLCTLVVLGSIEYELNFIVDCNGKKRENKCKSYCNIFGFSTYMVAPVGITYLDKNNIKVKIESICSDLLDTNTVFISTGLLLYY